MNSKKNKQTKTKGKEAEIEGSGNSVGKSQGEAGACSHMTVAFGAVPDVCGARARDGTVLPDHTCKHDKVKTQTRHDLCSALHFDNYIFLTQWKARFEFRIPGFLGFCPGT